MFAEKDKNVLRDLARRVGEMAATPVMQDRISLWKKHNRLQKVRPMILIFPEGSWRELLPGTCLQCESDDARSIEWELRARIYTHEHFASDNVIAGDWVVNKTFKDSGWGVQAKWHLSGQNTGARGFDPVITCPEDLKKMKVPVIEYDEDSTMRRLAQVHDLFDGILDVKLRGVTHISYHLMSLYTSLRGLEQVMIDMYENPEMLHDAMAFLADGHQRMLCQFVEQGLLSLNNDNTYHSSGGNGWTDELPPRGFNPDHVMPCDMWSSAESQEMAQVSPEMHNEFCLTYEKRLLANFGLNGYGCCEDLTHKLDFVCDIPRLRRISISPWADVDVCAAKLKGKYIFSWKPHPAHLVGHFDSARIRTYIRHALDAAKANGCVLEMILKDTHTCENMPERFDHWSQIAREEVGA